MFDFNSHIFGTLASIVALKAARSTKELMREVGFEKSFESVVLPDEFRGLRIRRKTSATSVTQFYQQHKFLLDFEEDLLGSLDKITEMSQPVAHFYSLYILSSFVVWLWRYINEKRMEGFLVLLNALKFDVDENPATRAALDDAFIDLYHIVLEEGKTGDDVLKITSQFYTKRNELPPLAYHCFATHFEMSVKMEGSLTGTISVQLINFLTLLVMERPKQFETETILLMVSVITPFLEYLDLPALMFYEHMAKLMPQEECERVSKQFPKAICEFLRKSPRYFVLPEPSNDVYELDGTMKEISYNFADEEDLGDLGSYGAILGDKGQSCLGHLCAVAMITRLSAIHKATSFNEQLTSVFLHELVETLRCSETEEFYLDLLAVFVGYCSLGLRDIRVVNFADILLKSVIFDPKYTVYDSKDNFEALGAARDYSIELMLKQGADTTMRLFKSIATYPGLFAEVCERTIFVVEILKQLTLQDKSLLRSLCIFQHNFSGTNRYCALARRAMFKLFQELFVELSITESLFKDQMFLSYFLAALFNSEERPIILETMTTFMINFHDEINSRFLVSIEQIVRQGCQTFPDPRGVQLICDIFNALFEVFGLYRDLAPKFWFIVSIFTENAKKIDKSYFDYIFYYLRYLPDTYSSHNINELANAILNDMKLERDDALYKKLMEVISPDHVTVERPLLIKLLLICFWDEKREKIMDDLIDLCQLQSNNTIACSRSGIDVFLVAKMKQEKECDAKALRLLELIAGRVSSPVVVHNFISLFCPDENGNPSPNQRNYIEFLNKMILKNYDTPISVLESGTSMNLSFKSNGYFAFAGWVFNESNSEFELLDMPGYSRVSFLDGCIFIGDESTGCQIPTKRWFLLTIVFQPKEVSIYIGQDQITTVEHDICYQGPVVVLAGASGRGRLGSFGFFPVLSKKQVQSIFQDGPRRTVKPSFPCHVYFTPREIQDFKLSQTKDPEIMTFADVLLKTCRIELLLPLFAQLSSNSESSDEYTSRIESVLSLFRSVLLIDEEQQVYFAGIRGFSIIAHLLLSSGDKALTFNLYNAFFNLSQEFVNEELRNQLILDILLNFELWTRTPDFVRIANHWKNVLFPSCESLVILPSQLIDWMRIYLWYEDKDTLIRPRNLSETELSSVRTSLNKIIAEKYAKSLTKYDMVLLLSHCLTSEDVSQVYDNLVLFHDISAHLAPFVTILESFMGMSILLLSQNDLIVTTTLALIGELHKRKFPMDMVFSEHLNIVFHQFKHREISETLLMKISVLIQNDLPELFEVGSYLAIKHGADFVHRFYDSLAPSYDFCHSHTWSLWAVYSVIEFGDLDILDFLIKCSCDHWKRMFYYIERICEVKGRECESLQKEFLLRLTAALKEEKVVIHPAYAELVQCFMFARKGVKYNSVLRSEFAEQKQDPVYEMIEEKGVVDSWNEFVISSPCLSKSASRITVADDDDLEKLLIQTQLDITPRVFGLRVNTNGEWLDSDLARESSSLIVRNITEQNLELLLLSFVFLVKFDRDFVKTVMSSTSISVDLIRKQSEMVNLVTARIDGCSPVPDHILALNRLCERLNQNLSTFTSQLFADIRQFMRLTLRKAQYFYGRTTGPLIHYGPDHLNGTIEHLNEAHEANTKNWRMIWSHMTIDHAPWNYRQNKYHYKRDILMNYACCPFLTKINRRFNQYTEAAEMRDSGIVLEKKPQSTTPTHPLEILNEIPKDPPKLVADDEFVTTADCHLVTIKGAKEVKFSLGREMVKVGNKVFKVADIAYVYWRRFKFHLTGIEIVFKNGRSVLIDFISFSGKAMAEQLHAVLRSTTAIVQRVPFADFVSTLPFTARWINGEISNFEYLMRLNIIGGRSFHDPSQYPLLPWVISDYERKTFDIDDPGFYRDLSKPVGALGKERIEELRRRLADLQLFGVNQFLYSSYCSSPLTVFWFLIRMEPFTRQHIEIQGGRFDNSQRIFWSIPCCHKSVLTQMSDYKELPPEFYFQPEFLCNIDKYDFGKIDGAVIDDVVLPPWAKNSMEFVYLHRKALESDYVSKTLHRWVDLTFGYQQRGEEAMNALNVYKEEMYDDIWTKESQQSEVRRAEIETMIEQVGQVPPQLFMTPHKQKQAKIVTPVFQEGSVITVDSDKYIFATFWQPNNARDRCKIQVFTAEGQVQQVKVIFGVPPEVACDVYEVKQGIPDDITECVSLSGSKFVALCNRDLEAVLIDTEANFKNSKITTVRQKITSLSASDGLFVMSSDDARTHVYSVVGEVKHVISIPTYRNCILCSCVSRQFGIVVSGTDDGELIIGSLDNGSTIRVIKTNAIPQKVLVTPSWGFIIANGCEYVNGKPKYSISVYNVNGVHIRTVEFESAVGQWVSWSNPAGFDFVILSGDKGKLYAFEAFFCDVATPFYRCCNDLIALEYSQVSQLVCAVTAEGRIHFVPFSSTSVEKYVCKT